MLEKSMKQSSEIDYELKVKMLVAGRSVEKQFWESEKHYLFLVPSEIITDMCNTYTTC